MALKWEDLIEKLDSKFRATILAFSLATNVWLALSLKDSLEASIKREKEENDRKQQSIDVLNRAFDIMQYQNSRKWQTQDTTK